MFKNLLTIVSTAISVFKFFKRKKDEAKDEKTEAELEEIIDFNNGGSADNDK